MAKSKTQSDFRDHVVSGLATITATQVAIVERLDKVNGNIRNHTSRLDALEQTNAETDGEKKRNALWLQYGWAVIGGVLVFTVEHFALFLQALLSK
jgi:hypothetical protein